jgi:hypothetical protein
VQEDFPPEIRWLLEHVAGSNRGQFEQARPGVAGSGLLRFEQMAESCPEHPRVTSCASAERAELGVAWCDDEPDDDGIIWGHVWGAGPDGWVRKGKPCTCLVREPCPRDVRPTHVSGWVSEHELSLMQDEGTAGPES